jgi:DNA primase
MAPKYDSERLNALPILRVAEVLGLQVNKSGMTHCFIHDEKTPSLHISDRKKLWHCFGCNAGGTVIDLVMTHENFEFLSACKWLTEVFDLSQTNDQIGRRKIPPRLNSGRTSRTNLSEYKKPDPVVYEWLFDNIGLSEAGSKYLTETRKLSEQTITNFNLRDVVNAALIFEIAKQKWGTKRLLDCGLAKLNDRNENRFAWWGHTLLIPFYNEVGDIVSIQGRVLNDPKYKYINLKDVPTEIFNARILGRLMDNARVCICEGAMDAITATQNGINAVGISGATGFKKEWIKRFGNFEIFVVPDNDEAGKNFSKRIQSMFEVIGRTIRIITLPADFKDVSDYFNSIRK